MHFPQSTYEDYLKITAKGRVRSTYLAVENIICEIEGGYVHQVAFEPFPKQAFQVDTLDLRKSPLMLDAHDDQCSVSFTNGM